jgi:hypothetical protein
MQCLPASHTPDRVAQPSNLWLAIAFAAIASQIACVSGEDRHHAIVAENIDLPANEWVELGNNLALRTPGDNNEVCLEPAAPFTATDDFSIHGPDGGRIQPKVRLVSERGEYPLENLSLTNLSLPTDARGEALCLGAIVGAKLATEYRAVRVWSPSRLALRRVTWNSRHK